MGSLGSPSDHASLAMKPFVGKAQALQQHATWNEFDVLIPSTCMQDKKASSSMDGVLDLAEIHGMLRQAICLLKGCEISVEDGSFNFVVTSALSWFRVSWPYSKRVCKISLIDSNQLQS